MEELQQRHGGNARIWENMDSPIDRHASALSSQAATTQHFHFRETERTGGWKTASSNGTPGHQCSTTWPAFTDGRGNSDQELKAVALSAPCLATTPARPRAVSNTSLDGSFRDSEPPSRQDYRLPAVSMDAENERPTASHSWDSKAGARRETGVTKRDENAPRWEAFGQSEALMHSSARVMAAPVTLKLCLGFRVNCVAPALIHSKQSVKQKLRPECTLDGLSNLAAGQERAAEPGQHLLHELCPPVPQCAAGVCVCSRRQSDGGR